MALPLSAKYLALKIRHETTEVKKLFRKFNIVFYPVSLAAALFIIDGIKSHRYTLNIEGNGYTPLLKVIISLLALVFIAALEKHGYKNLPNNGIAARAVFRTIMLSWIAAAAYYYLAFTMSESDNLSSGGPCAAGNMREITCITIALYTAGFAGSAVWVNWLFKKRNNQKRS